MNKGTFSIGTDPEFFLQNEQLQIVSAIPYLKGTKYEPTVLSTGGGLSKDNVALEFFTPPKTSCEEFVSIIRDSFVEVYKNIPIGFNIIPKASHTFDRKFLTHPEAKRFGCDPDYNAWNFLVNPPASSKTQLRSCGAHIHVGFFKEFGFEFLDDPVQKIMFVRLLDAMLGICSVIIDSSESSIRRRELYGKAGCYRPTNYGIEYRVLSNFWLTSPKLVEFTYKIVERALLIKENNDDTTVVSNIGEDIIQECINNGNREVAKVVAEGSLSKDIGADLISDVKELCNLNFDIRKEWRI